MYMQIVLVKLGNWTNIAFHVRPHEAPYIPSEAEKEDPILYASNVQESMEKDLARVRQEVTKKSWKEAAGRKDGGLGYKFGDISWTVARSLPGY